MFSLKLLILNTFSSIIIQKHRKSSVRMGRNKMSECEICFKSFRSDTLRRHMTQHGNSQYKKKPCPICKKLMLRNNLMRHIKTHCTESMIEEVHKNPSRQNVIPPLTDCQPSDSTMSVDHDVFLEEIKKNIMEDMQLYNKLKHTGKIVGEIILADNNIINPKVLREEYRKALDIIVPYDTKTEEDLKPWQNDLLRLLVPSERKIIWVFGIKGNEGKTWFQDFLEQFSGVGTVFRSCIDKKKESILHSLTKTSLSLVNMFVFNVPRSFEERDIPYRMFEEIKDGFSISTKYDSKQVRFKTPNIVIVFANYFPDTKKVSCDRWEIYSIANSKLICHSDHKSDSLEA